MNIGIACRYSLVSALLVVAGCNSTPAKPLPPDSRVGIVLMHGKGGMPKSLDGAARIMRDAGVLVVTPEMPWSRGRGYAKDYADSMQEIGGHVRKLRDRGVRFVFVGGHSMGANAALGYAVRHGDFDGLLLFAPGHVPGVSGFDGKVADSVARAAQMLAEGKDETTADFDDFNQGRRSTIRTSAAIYSSWFDPHGPAVMSTNAAALAPGIPVFCADGRRESHPKCGDARAHLAPGVSMDTVTVDAEHRNVPDMAASDAVEWMRALVSK